MKLSSLLFGIILFGIIGCATQKRCNEKFPPITLDSVIVKDSVYTVHDTIYTPYEELSFDTAIPCDPKIVYVREVKKGGLTGSVNIQNGKIKFECKSDSLQYIINSLRHEVSTFHVKKDSKAIEVEKPLNKFFTYGFFILLVIILLGVIWKLIKPKFNV